MSTNIRTYQGIHPNLADNVYVDESAVLVGDIKLDHDGHPLIIGDDVTIGHKAMLHGCKIGHRVLIGMGAILLDGAIVEDDVIVGAGSLVPPNKVLQSGYLYVGSPCKQVRPLTEAERAFLPQSADNYVRLKNEYLVDLQQ